MAGKSDITAGRAFVELALKNKAFLKGIDQAKKHLQSFGTAVSKVGTVMAAAGGGIVTSMAGAVGVLSESAAELRKVAVQTGATVEELSRLQHAAKRLRIDPDDLTGAIEELNIRIGETMRDGIGPAAEAFQQLGLDAEQLSRMPLPERLGAISDALSRISDQSTRGFLADEIFGGDAFKLLPLIRQGAEGIRALTEEADRLGVTMSSETAAAAAALGATLAGVQTAIMGAVNAIATALLPTMQRFADQVVSVAVRVGEWVRSNAGAAEGVLKLGIAVTGAGVAVIAAGKAIAFMGTVVGSVATVFSAATTAISVTSTVLAALLSPIGIITAAIAAMSAVVAKFAYDSIVASGDASRAFGNLSATFTAVWDNARRAFGGISDAIAVGDWKLAMEIIEVIVTDAFRHIVVALKGFWQDMLNAMVQGAKEVLSPQSIARNMPGSGMLFRMLLGEEEESAAPEDPGPRDRLTPLLDQARRQRLAKEQADAAQRQQEALANQRQSAAAGYTPLSANDIALQQHAAEMQRRQAMMAQMQGMQAPPPVGMPPGSQAAPGASEQYLARLVEMIQHQNAMLEQTRAEMAYQ